MKKINFTNPEKVEYNKFSRKKFEILKKLQMWFSFYANQWEIIPFTREKNCLEEIKIKYINKVASGVITEKKTKKRN